MSTAAISAALPLNSTPKAATPKLPAKQAPAGSSAATRAAPAAAASSATVAISAAAVALQEATETSVQTGKEAAGGDRTAQRLVAKQQASAADYSTTTSNAKAPAASAPVPGSIIDQHA